MVYAIEVLNNRDYIVDLIKEHRIWCFNVWHFNGKFYLLSLNPTKSSYLKSCRYYSQANIKKMHDKSARYIGSLMNEDNFPETFCLTAKDFELLYRVL